MVNSVDSYFRDSNGGRDCGPTRDYGTSEGARKAAQTRKSGGGGKAGGGLEQPTSIPYSIAASRRWPTGRQGNARREAPVKLDRTSPSGRTVGEFHQAPKGDWRERYAQLKADRKKHGLDSADSGTSEGAKKAAQTRATGSGGGLPSKLPLTGGSYGRYGPDIKAGVNEPGPRKSTYKPAEFRGYD